MKTIHRILSSKRIVLALISIPSLVYIGVQGKIGGTDTQHKSACTSGSKKENKKCREELEVLADSIERPKLN